MATEKFVCPHNEGVDCMTAKCERCGWNPDVQKAREAAMDIKKYTIPFKGYCEVWANSPEEAAQKADNDELFFVHYDFDEPISPEKEDKDELD